MKITKEVKTTITKPNKIHKRKKRISQILRQSPDKEDLKLVRPKRRAASVKIIPASSHIVNEHESYSEESSDNIEKLL